MNGRDSVLPTNLFALCVCTAVVRDSYFVNPCAGSGDLCDKFGFNPETIFLYCYTLQKIAAESFVTSLHIGEVQIGKHVRKQGEKSISHHMPKIDHPMRPASHKPRTEYDVGAIFQDWGNKEGILFRIIL